MSAEKLLQELDDLPTVLERWREIREEIHDLHSAATSSEQRGALLAAFHAVMDAVEATVDPDDMTTFREARAKDYNLFIVRESMIGENVSAELLDEVTQRELRAGRMSSDHDLRQLAVSAMAAPHLSRTKLREIAEKGAASTTSSLWRRAVTYLFKKRQ